MALRIAVPDLISPSYFPLIAAVELGYLADDGHDAKIELRYPVTEMYAALRDGDLDYVGGAAHAALYAFPDWQGIRMLGALSQGTYWYLVVRADLEVTDGDLEGVRGLRIGAAPGPVDALRAALADAGIDPDRDVELGRVTAANAGVSFGVAAAKALEEGSLDAFWANGMGAQVAVERGVGRVVLDARRGPRPAALTGYTFPALVTTDDRVEHAPEEARAVLRAVVRAQRALQDDPSLATTAAETSFPSHELRLIAGQIANDRPFYEATVAPDTLENVHCFGQLVGLTRAPSVSYDAVVVHAGLREEWT